MLLARGESAGAGHTAFRSLLRMAARRQPVTYKMLIAAESTG